MHVAFNICRFQCLYMLTDIFVRNVRYVFLHHHFCTSNVPLQQLNHLLHQPMHWSSATYDCFWHRRKLFMLHPILCCFLRISGGALCPAHYGNVLCQNTVAHHECLLARAVGDRCRYPSCLQFVFVPSHIIVFVIDNILDKQHNIEPKLKQHGCYKNQIFYYQSCFVWFLHAWTASHIFWSSFCLPMCPGPIWYRYTNIPLYIKQTYLIPGPFSQHHPHTFAATRIL